MHHLGRKIHDAVTQRNMLTYISFYGCNSLMNLGTWKIYRFKYISIHIYGHKCVKVHDIFKVA